MERRFYIIKPAPNHLTGPLRKTGRIKQSPIAIMTSETPSDFLTTLTSR
jgi:hypothetical protein